MTIGLDFIDFLIAQNTHQPLYFLVHQFYHFWNQGRYSMLSAI
jgi:hypothetical protein